MICLIVKSGNLEDCGISSGEGARYGMLGGFMIYLLVYSMLVIRNK